MVPPMAKVGADRPGTLAAAELQRRSGVLRARHINRGETCGEVLDADGQPVRDGEVGATTLGKRPID